MMLWCLVKSTGEVEIVKSSPWRRRLKMCPSVANDGTITFKKTPYRYDRKAELFTTSLHRFAGVGPRETTELLFWRAGRSEPLDLTSPSGPTSLWSADVVGAAVESHHIQDIVRTDADWKIILLVLFGGVSVAAIIALIVMLWKA